MNPQDIKVCILRAGGTNCDAETQRAFQELGTQAHTLQVSELIKHRNLLDYDVLVFPGGFSYGDYVRSGVIFARHLSAHLDKEIQSFIDEGRPILGICNGFQILVEYGLLPGFEGISPVPEAALTTNEPAGFKCKWVYLKQENQGRCLFTSSIPQGKVIRLPIAHGEGRLLFPKEKEETLLKRLVEEDMLVFRYCTKDGQPANGQYPTNPNGSFYDIAGICNPEGNIFGLMPHPERALYWWQQPNWTRQNQMLQYGDGKHIFQSIIDKLTKT
ncbi:phosphoribosylformylglycinamidine synthase subunit PurQ [Candidatus Bathycorpusculum sp.]|jgi:phosphoribosylformylglycinamidine synthase|uniref:phosphoribosylformylglycinamidine synthase subunit PurQ n=1 Tax=Candidatus Bathycorpusculum sp. TaxID=2994959 RepID=UPI002820B7B6|nr:phosphoribosylformylglycinamidine synthase subunit PurQ [Candidatus Termitimicrobium sp.]MCL2686757.1 phosphoribosylformylglycinamidine synthase subunit PurQ [Candidatus Termitimicrobium sp.]